jgi:hypothetical protein
MRTQRIIFEPVYNEHIAMIDGEFDLFELSGDTGANLREAEMEFYQDMLDPNE